MGMEELELLIIREKEEVIIVEIPRYGLTKAEALQKMRKWWQEKYGETKDRILLLEGIKRLKIVKKQQQ